MSVQSRPENGGNPIEPINNAAFGIAMTLHQRLLQDMQTQSGQDFMTFEDEVRQQGERYPFILLGELAMHVAKVSVTPDANPVDRARGIFEAFRKISQTPELFEAVTNLPFSTDLAGLIAPHQAEPTELSEKAINEAKALRQKIAEAGFLNRSMVPNGRTIRLFYEASDTIKVGRFSRKKLEPESSLTLTLSPSAMHWVVRQYREWRETTGFSNFIGERKIDTPCFNLIAVEATHPLPRSLAKLIGKNLNIGTVSPGAQLKLEHSYYEYTQEVPTYEKEGYSQTLTLPAVFKQAYFGNSNQLPLF